MPPRPAPDLDLRRDLVIRSARGIAESEGWPAVTMRRLAGALGVTQPVLYSAFDGRQAVVDAVALGGFIELADALDAAAPELLDRMRTYLDFAARHPRAYEAMFALPLGMPFAADGTPEPLRRAFAGLRQVVPDTDETQAEVTWATLHGLATLQAGGRLRADEAEARLVAAHRLLAGPPLAP